MKTIGLIGGLSWESTVSYYRQINEAVKARLGGLHSAKIVLQSVDFQEIVSLQNAGDWEGIGDVLAAAGRSLQGAGSDLLLLCTNTMHKVAVRIETSVDVPFLHIVDAAAHEIRSAGCSKVGLLGTRFTMEESFYVDRLSELHGLEVVVPPAEDRVIVSRVIYEELCLGIVNPESRREYRRIMAGLASSGAEGIILGCTEIALLVDQGDSEITLFDTTAIHVRAAVEAALG